MRFINDLLVRLAERVLEALDVDFEDDEEFCPTCFAGMESSQHYFDRRCGAVE